MGATAPHAGAPDVRTVRGARRRWRIRAPPQQVSGGRAVRDRSGHRRLPPWQLGHSGRPLPPQFLGPVVRGGGRREHVHGQCPRPRRGARRPARPPGARPARSRAPPPAPGPTRHACRAIQSLSASAYPAVAASRPLRLSSPSARCATSASRWAANASAPAPPRRAGRAAATWASPYAWASRRSDGSAAAGGPGRSAATARTASPGSDPQPAQQRPDRVLRRRPRPASVSSTRREQVGGGPGQPVQRVHQRSPGVSRRRAASSASA